MTEVVDQDIQQANKILLEKREAIKRERENTIISLKNFLQQNNSDAAKGEADKLRDTPAWGDVLKEFESQKPKAKCGKCGSELRQSFNEQTLDWSVSVCFSCRIAEEKEKIEAENKRVDKYLRDHIDSYLIKRGVGERFLCARIDDFPGAYKSLAQSKEGLYLFGDRGVGKTHLAIAIMREIIARDGVSKIPSDIVDGVFSHAINEKAMPQFITVPELLLKIRSSFDEDSQRKEEDIIDEYGYMPILILDDMGVEKTTEWSMQTLYTIIDRRYSKMKKTIITSNLNLEELSLKVGDRIASRISGMCQVKKLKGEDKRAQR